MFKNNISIIKPPYEMLSNIQFKKGYIDIIIESGLDKSAIVNQFKDTEYKVNIFEIKRERMAKPYVLLNCRKK